MTSQTFVLLSGVLTFGVPLAVALYELMTLRPSPKGGDDRWEPPQLPRAPKPLPECLLPRPIPVPGRFLVRVLEDA